MKIAILLATVLAVSVYADGTCPTFACKGLSQPSSGNKICTDTIEGDTTKINVQNACEPLIQRCDSGTGASSNPNNFLKKFSCTTNTTTIDENDQIAVGDFCNTTAKLTCIAGLECTDNFCVQPTDTDAACKTDNIAATSLMCPPGQYCVTDGDNANCKPIAKAGETCAAAGSQSNCGYASLCLDQTPNGGDKTTICTTYGSVANAVELGSVTKETMSAFAIYCKSGHIYEKPGATGDDPSTFFCMPGNKNTGDVTSAMAFGADCPTETFTDVTDATKSAAGKNTAMCGFNQKDESYCPLQTGDDQFMNAWSAVASDMQGAYDQCNVMSSGVGSCKNLRTTENINTAFTAGLQNQLATNLQGWPNVANNAGCVKQTLTYWYWSSASIAGVAAAAVGAMAIVF